MAPIEASDKLAAVIQVSDSIDNDDHVAKDLAIAMELSAKEANEAVENKEAEELAYKQALENSLAGVREGSQLAEQAFLMQGLSSGSASSGDSKGSVVAKASSPTPPAGAAGSGNGSAHAGSPTNLAEAAIGNASGQGGSPASPTPTPTPAYSAPATPMTDDNAGEVNSGSGKAWVGAPPPEDIDLSLLCGDCGHALKVKKGVRFLRKTTTGGKEFQCGGCNNKSVGLRRTFGTWPIEEFKGLEEEEKKSFMAIASNKTKDLENELSNMLTKKFVESHKSSMRGQFLPLQVWATMGWDAKKIEETADPEDIESTKLGKTYRVKIHETEEAKLTEKCRGEVMNLLNKYKKSSGTDKRGRSDSGDESNSESRHERRSKKTRRQERRRRRRSSSSRSRSPARVRAAAKVEEVKPPEPAVATAVAVAAAVAAAANADPKKQAAAVKAAAAEALKAAKARAAEQKKAESAAARAMAAEAKKAQTALAKETSARKAACSKAIKSVSAFACRFEQVMAEPLFKTLPTHIVEDAKTTGQTLVKIKQVAEANLDGRVPSAESSVLLSTDHIEVFTKNAPKVLKSIDEFMAAMAKYQ